MNSASSGVLRPAIVFLPLAQPAAGVAHQPQVDAHIFLE
jgi:hypothetical protein